MPNDKLTGYPSIDKPWLKYYSEEERTFDLDASLYCNFTKVVDKKPHELAYIDFNTGYKVTYSELLKQVDDFANSLGAYGIGRESRVGILSFNCSVEPIVLLGTNKLGATVIFLNPDSGSLEITKNTQLVDILIVESIFAEIEPIINTNRIPAVIYGYYPYFPSSNCISYNDFLARGVTHNIIPITSNDNNPFLVIYSSGSTGTAKPIVHSGYTVSAAVNKMLYSDFPINGSNLLVKAIPSHIGLGVITTMLTGLLAGVTYVQLKGLPDPAMGLAEETFRLIVHFYDWLGKNQLKREGLLLFAAPYFAKYILSRIEEINDLSMLKAVLLGGSKMAKEDLDMMDCLFREKGLEIPICNGYGQNEMGGAVTLNTVHHNKNGSAGYPVYGTNIRIVDRHTKEDVVFNTEGLILEQGDSRFIYYMNMPENTEKAKVRLPDGSEWYNSTDLGYMDEDGFLYITGRTTRVVIKTDHKISLDSIEEKIRRIGCVEDVAAVSPGDEDIFVYIVANSEVSESEMFTLIRGKDVDLDVFEMPKSIELIEDLPRMNNGKVDYMKLEEMARQAGGH